MNKIFKIWKSLNIYDLRIVAWPFFLKVLKPLTIILGQEINEKIPKF